MLKSIEVDVLTQFILETVSIVNLLRAFQQQIDQKYDELNKYMDKYQIDDMLCSELEKDLNPYSDFAKQTTIFSDQLSSNTFASPTKSTQKFEQVT